MIHSFLINQTVRMLLYYIRKILFYNLRIRSFLQEMRYPSLLYWWSYKFFPNGITRTFLLFSSFSLEHLYMLWIEWISYFFDFVLSLVLFDGLIITSLRVFVNTFLCFYAIIITLLLLFVNTFLHFISIFSIYLCLICTNFIIFLFIW